MGTTRSHVRYIDSHTEGEPTRVVIVGEGCVIAQPGNPFADGLVLGNPIAGVIT